MERNAKVPQGLPLFLTTLWDSPEQLATTLRWLTILGIVSTAAFAAAAYFVNDRIGVIQAAQILNQDNAIRSQKNNIDNQSQTISRQSEQITHLTDDLKSVREQASVLTLRAQNAERGISDTYDFNGVHRQNMGGGRVTATAGQEMVVFQKIIKLYDDKDWSGLGGFCEDQIQKTPGWLTPYMFSGIAYSNLGNIPLAKERIEFVASKAGSDASYSDATRILAQLRSVTQREVGSGSLGQTAGHSAE